MPQIDLQEAIKGIEEYANKHYDGHYTIMKFTTGYKVVFGTPEFTRRQYLYIWNLPIYKNIVAAILNTVLSDTEKP